MSEDRIHAPRDKHMSLPTGNLHRMIEVTAGLRHGHAADRLAQHHQEQANGYLVGCERGGEV